MDIHRSVAKAYGDAAGAYNNALRSQHALARATIDANAAYTDAYNATINANDAVRDAVNRVEDMPAAASDIINTYMSMDDLNPPLSIFERAEGAANVAHVRATKYHDIIENAFKANNPDIMHIKHAAAAWADATDKKKDAATKRATLADTYANKFKRAAADMPAYPDIWPLHTIYKLTEAGAAWERARDACMKVAAQEDEAGAAWSALDKHI